MRHKLAARGFAEDHAVAELDRLAASGLQSDRRFSESYLEQRAGRGYGPARIVLEMRERGIADELAKDVMNESEIDWRALARTVRTKRFGNSQPADFKERARQMRFLQYRGFGPDQIRAALHDND